MRERQDVGDEEGAEVAARRNNGDGVSLVALVAIFVLRSPDVFVSDEKSDWRLRRDFHRRTLATAGVGRLQIGDVIQIVWLIGLDGRISD